jgi:RNA polymerase sigma-70 factor (ECF subfamily)
MQLGRHGEARAAFDQAIALANTAAEAAHIRMHIDRLIKDSAAPEPARRGGTS